MTVKQKTIGWHHPVDDSDQWDGFNEPGIEHFRGNPIVHLAREVNQNASDAADSDADAVTVRIMHREVSVDGIPNVQQLRVNLMSCSEASKKEGKKATIFFENALAELKKKKISILEISDYNTRGMKGPSENGSAFYAFMKAKGQSKKESEDAGGSYGIGKFAPYAVSKIRTIFISTVYQDDNNKYVQLTQGKSILMSHDQKGMRKQGVGYWGEIGKCQPIVGVSPDLPEWLQRANSSKELPKSKGSKLTVLCFDATKNWEEHLAVSVAENFFGAIHGGRLRVEIGDNKYVLDQKNIVDFFGNGSIRALIESEKLSKGEPEQFDNCKNYLTVLRGGTEVWTEESQMQHLGLCQVKILIGEKLPRKVCVLRNGMFITDSLSGLKTFSDFKEFVAVFHCQSKQGNELLRAMEPPRHDDFEPDRLPTKEEQVKGRAALRDISKWVREMLRRHAKDPVSEITELDELKDFFGDEGDGETGKGAEEINPYGNVIIRAKPISTRVKVSSASTGDFAGDNDGDLDGGGGNLGEGGGDGKGGAGNGEGGSSGGNGKALVDINNVRAILVSGSARKLAFTPIQSGKVSVHIKEAGADSDYDISIVKSNAGGVNNGGVLLDVIAGVRVVLDVELNQDFSGALKVVAYEI